MVISKLAVFTSFVFGSRGSQFLYCGVSQERLHSERILKISETTLLSQMLLQLLGPCIFTVCYTLLWWKVALQKPMRPGVGPLAQASCRLFTVQLGRAQK